jgi:hypothetical protein
MPKMVESETFLFSAIQSLANNISVSFNMMNNRMNQLETKRKDLCKHTNCTENTYRNRGWKS